MCEEIKVMEAIVDSNRVADIQPMQTYLYMRNVTISGINGVPEEKLVELLEKPIMAPSHTKERKVESGQTSPQVIQSSMRLKKDARDRFPEFTGKVFLTDFSHSFVADPSPMAKALPWEQDWGVSPGFTLEQTENGYAKDIWALGEMIYQIRIGHGIFSPCRNADARLANMCQVLGKMPEPMWSTTWKGRDAYFKDEVDAEGLVVDIDEDQAAESAAMRARGEESRSLREWLTNCYNTPPPKGTLKLKKKEIDLFADLLGKIFTWKAEDRISLEGIEKHPWFTI